MGNLSSLLSEHSVGDQIASGGPSNIWKVFNAKRRQTNETVSLFVFDKSQLEKYPRNQREEALKMLRHEIRHLTKLRHPRVLSILKPEQETKKAIVIETEPIFSSLSNILRDYTNISPPNALKGFELEPLEMKIGIMHLAEAISFIHNNANLIHRNITPSSIYITKKGEWKLSGFNFSVHANYQPGVGKSLPVKEFNNTRQPLQTEPDLDYIAPEYVFTKQYDYASDLFSLGCVVFQVYAGKKLLNNMNNVLNYKQNIEQLHRCITSTRNLPPELSQPLSELLRINPRDRSAIQTFMSSSYFQDVNIQSLAFLSSLLEIDNGKKAAFFKGFAAVLGNFTPRIIDMKILPPLLQELKNTVQIPFVLPIIIEISEKVTPRKFETAIFPSLVPLLRVSETGASPPIAPFFLEHLSLFISKLSGPTVEKQLLPFLYQILEGSSLRLQDLIIRKIPEIAQQIEYSTLISKITPRVVTIVGSQPGLRLNGLVCINKLIPSLDRGHIMEQILPVIESFSNVQDPKILTAIFHCFSSMNPKVGPLIAAQRLLPFLTPLSVNGSLQQEQFDLLMNTMNMMLQSIVDWRKDEFQSQAEVAKQLEEDHQQDFIKHKNFEDLVGNEFRVKQSSHTSAKTNQRTITNTAPPSEETISSFEELIREEEVQRQKHIHAQSQSHIFSDIGGAAVSQQKETGNFKNLHISDSPSLLPSVSSASSSDFGFSSFSANELPPSPKVERPSNMLAPTLTPQVAASLKTSTNQRTTSNVFEHNRSVNTKDSFSGWGDASSTFKGLKTPNPTKSETNQAPSTASAFDNSFGFSAPNSSVGQHNTPQSTYNTPSLFDSPITSPIPQTQRQPQAGNDFGFDSFSQIEVQPLQSQTQVNSNSFGNFSQQSQPQMTGNQAAQQNNFGSFAFSNAQQPSAPMQPAQPSEFDFGSFSDAPTNTTWDANSFF